MHPLDSAWQPDSSPVYPIMRSKNLKNAKRHSGDCVGTMSVVSYGIHKYFVTAAHVLEIMSRKNGFYWLPISDKYIRVLPRPDWYIPFQQSSNNSRRFRYDFAVAEAVDQENLINSVNLGKLPNGTFQSASGILCGFRRKENNRHAVLYRPGFKRRCYIFSSPENKSLTFAYDGISLGPLVEFGLPFDRSSWEGFSNGCWKKKMARIPDGLSGSMYMANLGDSLERSPIGILVRHENEQLIFTHFSAITAVLSPNAG